MACGGIHFEGPSWAEDENALYWVDIHAQNVLKLDVNSGNVTKRHVGKLDKILEGAKSLSAV